MTDRINALTVVLDEDYRTDDVEAIVNAVKMVKGVMDVKPNIVNFVDGHAIEVRVKDMIAKKLWDILYPED